MKPANCRSVIKKPVNQTGFGLIEIMVGLGVGVIIMLATYASVSFYLSAKRTAISGNNAVANAISGIYLLGNDLKLAGLGLTVGDELICPSLNAFYNGEVKADAGVVAPVMIQAGGNAPDTISIMTGSSVLSGAGVKLLTNMTSATAPIQVNRAVGDSSTGTLLLAMPGTNLPCTLIEATNVVNNANFTRIMHNNSAFNPASPATVFTNAPIYTTDAVLINAAGFRWLTWQLNNNELEVVDNMTDNQETIADNIVQLKAQYGVTPVNGNSINQWVDATGEWANLDSDHIRRIRAIRVALAARSTKREANLDGNNNCNTTPVALTTWEDGPDLDLSADPNWRCYRYRVLKSVFPLRNIMWGLS